MLIRQGLSSIAEELMRQHGLLTSTAPDKPLPAAMATSGYHPRMRSHQKRKDRYEYSRQIETVPAMFAVFRHQKKQCYQRPSSISADEFHLL